MFIFQLENSLASVRCHSKNHDEKGGGRKLIKEVAEYQKLQ